MGDVGFSKTSGQQIFSDEDYARFDRELIETRRALLSLPPDDVVPEVYYDGLEKKEQELVGLLEDAEFRGKRFDPSSAIYRQSFWKYMEFFGRCAADKKISYLEGNQLYSMAYDSEDIGIKYFFKNLVSGEPVLYRWGGFSGTSTVSDRDVTLFSAGGGMKFNFASAERQMHTNKTGFFEYGYDPHLTVSERPYGLVWEEESQRAEFERESKFWVSGATPMDMNDLLTEKPESFLFPQGSQKRSLAITHINNIKYNIDNIGLVEQEINFLMSLFVHPQAVHTTVLTLIMVIMDAETIDMGTKNLYVGFIARAFEAYVDRANEFVFNVNKLDGESFEKTKAIIAAAVRQDAVAIHGVVDSNLYIAAVDDCEEPLSKCSKYTMLRLEFAKGVLSRMIPMNLIQRFQGEFGDDESLALDKLMKEWSVESYDPATFTVPSVADNSIFWQLSQGSNSCELSCRNKIQTEKIIRAALKYTMSAKDRADAFNWSNWNEYIVSASLFLGMIFEGYFSKGVPADGFLGMFKNFFGVIRWVGATLPLIAFGESTWAGISMFTSSPEDILEDDRNQAPFRSAYNINGRCECGD